MLLEMIGRSGSLQSEQKLLRVQSGSHIGPFYSPDGIADQMAFFDYWLKGIDNGIMNKPPVKIAIKTGDAAWLLLGPTRMPGRFPRRSTPEYYFDAVPLEDDFTVDGSMPVYTTPAERRRGDKQDRSGHVCSAD